MYRLVFCFHDFHLGLWWAHLATPRSLIIFSVATSQAPKDKLRFIFGLADQDDSHLAGWIWMAFSNTCRFLDGQVLWSGEPTCPIWAGENTEPLYPGDTWVQSLPSAEATLWMNFNSWISSPPSCGALGQPLASSTRRPGRGLRAALGLKWSGLRGGDPFLMKGLRRRSGNISLFHTAESWLKPTGMAGGNGFVPHFETNPNRCWLISPVEGFLASEMARYTVYIHVHANISY